MIHYIINKSGQILGWDGTHIAATQAAYERGGIVISADIDPQRMVTAVPDGEGGFTIEAGAWRAGLEDFDGLRIALGQHPTLWPKAMQHGHANFYSTVMACLQGRWTNDFGPALTGLANSLPDAHALTSQERADLNALLDVYRFNFQVP